MKKQEIDEVIFEKHYDDLYSTIPFSDFPVEKMLPTDKVSVDNVQSYYSENESYDGRTILTIIRTRLQTDEEFEEFKKNRQIRLKKTKKERKELFLKLKKEFEPTNENS